MLSYGLDVSRSSGALLALCTICERGIGELLEAEHFTTKDAQPVLATMRKWECWYGEHCPGLCLPRTVVGCAQDGWPRELVHDLHEAGYDIGWVPGPPSQLEIHLDPQFIRARLLAHWPLSHTIPCSRRALLQAQYAVARHELMNLEAELYAEGQSLCPGHVSATCPECEDHPRARPQRQVADVGLPGRLVAAALGRP